MKPTFLEELKEGIEEFMRVQFYSVWDNTAMDVFQYIRDEKLYVGINFYIHDSEGIEEDPYYTIIWDYETSECLHLVNLPEEIRGEMVRGKMERIFNEKKKAA